MRIDAHQHFWHYDRAQYEWIDDSMAALRRDFLPLDLRRELDAGQMDACVAVQVRQSLDETSWLLSLAEANRFIVGVVGWVDLQADDVHAQLRKVGANPLLVGIRHIVQSEPDDRFLLRPAFGRGIAALEEFGLAYDILIYPRHLPYAVELASRFARQRFVLDHLAKPDIRRGRFQEWERDLRRLAACPNVWAKLSGLVTEADWHRWTPDQLQPCFDIAFDAFGADRLMVGSDWPVCTVAGEYAQVIGVVADYLAARPAAEREAVLGGNAQRFWNLRLRTVL
jgi:L-fucono-1,5-lactonase